VPLQWQAAYRKETTPFASHFSGAGFDMCRLRCRACASNSSSTECTISPYPSSVSPSPISIFVWPPPAVPCVRRRALDKPIHWFLVRSLDSSFVRSLCLHWWQSQLYFELPVTSCEGVDVIVTNARGRLFPASSFSSRCICRENLGLEINITMSRVVKLQNCSKRKVVKRKRRTKRNSVIIRIRKMEELITCTM
jgi:hypothetical protein